MNNHIEQGMRDAILDAYDILLSLDLNDYTNPCIVFDISDTLVDKRSGIRIQESINLYKLSIQLDLPVFIISARDPTDRKRTYNQLRMCNIHHIEDIYLVSRDNNAIQKRKARIDITERGYTILLNVGDASTDFEGGYYIHGIKLPTVPKVQIYNPNK